MGWFSEDKREARGWAKQIKMDQSGDWTQQALASRMKVCPKNPANGGRGSRDTSPRKFQWDVTETEGAQQAKSKGWWK